MRHAVLGAGAVGLCLAADLARTGMAVTLVMRPSSLAAYSGTVSVHNPDGVTRVAVPAVDRLAQPVDVTWIAVKRPHLEAALDAVEDTALAGALVVPLLNGTDHLPVLRDVYGPRVIAGAVWVDAHRTGVGEAVRRSRHTQVDLAVADPRESAPRQPTPGEPAPGETALGETALGETAPGETALGEAAPGGPAVARLLAGLRAAGVAYRRWPGDADVLWHKLCMLAPLALATAAAGGPLGVVRGDAALHDLMWRCAGEVRAAAATHGVPVTESQVRRRLAALPDDCGSSLQRDAERGEPLELAAISQPVLAAGVPAPATEHLVWLITQSSSIAQSG